MQQWSLICFVKWNSIFVIVIFFKLNNDWILVSVVVYRIFASSTITSMRNSHYSSLHIDCNIVNYWHFFTILNNSQHFLIIIDNSWQFLTVLNSSYEFLTILNNSQQFFTILTNSWHVLTIPTIRDNSYQFVSILNHS